MKKTRIAVASPLGIRIGVVLKAGENFIEIVFQAEANNLLGHIWQIVSA